MNVDPVTAAQQQAQTTGQWTPKAAAVTEQAHEQVVNQKTAQIQNDSQQAASAPASAPNVTTSPTFSPTIYAQAAQLQLYTQSGALAAMQAQHGVGSVVDQPLHEQPDAIQAVDSTNGSRVDAYA